MNKTKETKEEPATKAEEPKEMQRLVIHNPIVDLFKDKEVQLHMKPVDGSLTINMNDGSEKQRPQQRNIMVPLLCLVGASFCLGVIAYRAYLMSFSQGVTNKIGY